MDMRPFVKENLSDKVKRSLYEYIENMDFEQGTKLPPENEIAKSYGVSRVTVRRALDELEQEGLLLRIHGRGTFVNPLTRQFKINLAVSQEISELISKSGYEIKIRLAAYKEEGCDVMVASALGVQVGEPVIALEKGYYADGHLAILCQDYMAVSLFTKHPEKDDFINHSSYDVIRTHAGKLVVRDWIQIQNCRVSKMRSMSGLEKEFETDVLLEVIGRVYDQDNEQVLYGRVFYNTDYIRFNMVRNIIAY